MFRRGLVEQYLELAAEQKLLKTEDMIGHGPVLVLAEQADGFDFFVHARFPERKP